MIWSEKNLDSRWKSKNSIAILPFTNMSSDPENEYFSDGITEEIINSLVKIDDLQVTARTSTFAFKGKNEDVRTIGSQLGVHTILEGSIRKSGNRVRISAQLVNSSDGYHLWSDIFDRELEDIFEVQDEISQKIVEKLKEKLGEIPKEDYLADPPTENLEAYDIYLKGRFHLGKGSLEETKKAINLFETAINKDSKFVLAYSGLCACYTFFGGSRLMPSEEAFAKAKEYALMANEIDSNIAESHLALAYTSFWNDWDFESTFNFISKALYLSPGSADTHGFYSTFLLASSDLKGALNEAKVAIKLDPLSPSGNFRLAEYYYRSGKFKKAIEHFNLTLHKNPYFQQASILKAWSHLMNGEPDGALSIFNNIPVSSDSSITFLGAAAYAYSQKGDVEKVNDCLQNLEKENKSDNVHLINYSYSLIYRALKDSDRMFEYLKKSISEKVSTLVFIRVDPL